MPAGPVKTYLNAQDLLEDAYALSAKILDSGFKPKFMIAVWRGGIPIGIAVQEHLAFHGLVTDNIAIRTSSYSGIDAQSRKVKVFGLNYLVHHVEADDPLLIVDDVFDSGRSIDAIIKKIQRHARLNTPKDIRVAVPYYKPERNKTDRVPDYYIHETSEWLKYPHSLEGLNTAEIRQYRPELYAILKDHLPASD